MSYKCTLWLSFAKHFFNYTIQCTYMNSYITRLSNLINPNLADMTYSEKIKNISISQPVLRDKFLPKDDLSPSTKNTRRKAKRLLTSKLIHSDTLYASSPIAKPPVIGPDVCERCVYKFRFTTLAVITGPKCLRILTYSRVVVNLIL